MTKVETSVWYAAPTDAITEAARTRGADLIVMGTHGRTGLNRLLLGSVAESVLRSSTIPILMVRAGGPSVSAPRAAREREMAHV